MPNAVLDSVVDGDDDDDIKRGRFTGVFDGGEQRVEVDGTESERDDIDDGSRVLYELQLAYERLFPAVRAKRDAEFTRCFQHYDCDTRNLTLDSIISGDTPPTNPSTIHDRGSPHPGSKLHRDVIVPTRTQTNRSNDCSTAEFIDFEYAFLDAHRSAADFVDRSMLSGDTRHVTAASAPDRFVRGSGGHCCSIPPFLRPIEEEDGVSTIADEVSASRGNLDEMTSEMTSDVDQHLAVAAPDRIVTAVTSQSHRHSENVCSTGTPFSIVIDRSTHAAAAATMTSSVALSKPSGENHSVTSGNSIEVTAHAASTDLAAEMRYELSRAEQKGDAVSMESADRKNEQSRRSQLEWDPLLVLLVSVSTFAACLSSICPSYLVLVVAVTSLFYNVFNCFATFNSPAKANCRLDSSLRGEPREVTINFQHNDGLNSVNVIE